MFLECGQWWCFPDIGLKFISEPQSGDSKCTFTKFKSCKSKVICHRWSLSESKIKMTVVWINVDVLIVVFNLWISKVKREQSRSWTGVQFTKYCRKISEFSLSYALSLSWVMNLWFPKFFLDFPRLIYKTDLIRLFSLWRTVHKTTSLFVYKLFLT